MCRLQYFVRVRGIEPRFNAWEALVLPLNYTRSGVSISHISSHKKVPPHEAAGLS